MSETRIHFARQRVRGEADFYDAQADMRTVFPAAALMVIDDMKFLYKEDDEATKALSYLRNCVNVFRIRVGEDPTPLEELVDGFVKAIAKVPPRIFAQFVSGVFVMQSVVYGMFQRRDSQVDGPGHYQMLTTARLEDILRLIPHDLSDKIRETLRSQGAFKEAVVSVDQTSKADVIKEGETVGFYDHLKERAACFLEADGDTSWEGMAKACDEFFQSEGDKLSVPDKVAVTLAYPTYDFPVQCEMEVDDDAEGKAEPLA